MEGRVAAMEGHRTCNYGREEMERQRQAGRTYDMRWISMRCTCALHVCACICVYTALCAPNDTST